MRTFWIFLCANTVLILLAVFFHPYQIPGPPSKLLDGSGHEGHSETSYKMWCLLTCMSHRHYETLKGQNWKYKVKRWRFLQRQPGRLGPAHREKQEVCRCQWLPHGKVISMDPHSHNADNKEREVSMSEVTKKQFARTRETKEPQGIEAGAHLSSNTQDSHGKFSNSIQGQVWCVWCLLCPQTPLATEAAAEAEQSCKRCGRDDAGPVTAEDGQHSQHSPRTHFSYSRMCLFLTEITNHYSTQNCVHHSYSQ